MIATQFLFRHTAVGRAALFGYAIFPDAAGIILRLNTCHSAQDEAPWLESPTRRSGDQSWSEIRSVVPVHPGCTNVSLSALLPLQDQCRHWWQPGPGRSGCNEEAEVGSAFSQLVGSVRRSN